MTDAASTKLTPQLVMRRPHVQALPPIALPPDGAIRFYESVADEAAWDRIIGDSFGMAAEGMFARAMRPDPAFRPERVFFVCRGAEPVATASAWFVARYGPTVGYLHYVGVLKAHAGLGLGLAASVASLRRLAAEGCTSAMLQTDDFRLPAIKQYLRLGFEPVLVDENQRTRWPEVFRALNHPGLIDRFAAHLAGALYVPPTAH
jgi:mycothiol synthase